MTTIRVPIEFDPERMAGVFTSFERVADRSRVGSRGVVMVPLSRENALRVGASRELAINPVALDTMVALYDEPKGVVLQGRVGVVSIRGPLSQRALNMCGFVDGYDAITERFAAAHENRDIDAIIIDCDSPGGDCAGLDQAVDRMKRIAAKSGKPVFTYVNESAYSAMYCIIAGVSTHGISLPPSGGVGSIGVIGGFVDETAALEKEGVKITLVRWPAGKAESHSAAPISDLAESRIGTRVRAKAEAFFAHMAKARNLSVDTIRDFNGDTFDGEAAVKAGLADRVEDFESVVARAQAAGQKWRRHMEKSAMDQAKFDSLQAFQVQALAIFGAKDEASFVGKATAAKSALDEQPVLNAKLEAFEQNQIVAKQKSDDDRAANLMVAAKAANKVVKANEAKVQGIYTKYGLAAFEEHLDALVPVAPSAADNAKSPEPKPDGKSTTDIATEQHLADPNTPKFESMTGLERHTYRQLHGAAGYEALKNDSIRRGRTAPSVNR